MKTSGKRLQKAQIVVNSSGKFIQFANAFLITLLLSSIVPAHAAFAQEASPVSYTFQECDQIEEARLRDELNDITQSVFEPEQILLKIETIVDRKWGELDLDATIDAAVEAAIEKVRDDTDWWDRIRSNWSAETAKDLTNQVATYAFGSDSFVTAVNQLSEDIAAELVAELRVMTVKSASSALQCVQAFIGDTFSQTMAAVLEEQIKERFDEIVVDPDPENATILDIVELHPELLGGVAFIVGTQLAKGIAQKVAQNIAGQVILRILGKAAVSAIPLVGWIIGGGLIVWDVIKAGEGAFPQIQNSLQGEQTKAELRRHIANAVDAELQEELNLQELARNVSNDVYSKWQEFRKKYVRVLDLAETNMRFKGILDNTPAGEVKKLADLVAVLEAKFGLDRLESLLNRGHFGRLFALPYEIIEMIELGVDPEAVIAWADLAGELIVQVVSLELYRVASPTDFMDRSDLERVLALNDAGSIQKAMLLNLDVRDAVLGLTTTHIEQVLETLSSDELTWLAKGYLTKLEPQERTILVDRILREPDVKLELKKELIQESLLESSDFEETLTYITQKTRRRQLVGQVLDSVSMIGPTLSGELPWALFWHYDGAVLRNMLYALAGLVVLAILWRKIVPRRRRQDVNVTVVLPEDRGSNESDNDARQFVDRNRKVNGK